MQSSPPSELTAMTSTANGTMSSHQTGKGICYFFMTPNMRWSARKVVTGEGANGAVEPTSQLLCSRGQFGRHRWRLPKVGDERLGVVSYRSYAADELVDFPVQPFEQSPLTRADCCNEAWKSESTSLDQPTSTSSDGGSPRYFATAVNSCCRFSRNLALAVAITL